MTTNALPGARTFPDGLDVEVVATTALERAWREAKRPSEREHVTPFLYAHPELFRIGSVANAVDLSQHRWTVDEPVDLEVVRAVFGELYESDPAFGWERIVDLFQRRPELGAANAHIPTNEGYARSLAEEGQA